MNENNINIADINRITLDLSVPRIVNVRCVQGDDKSRQLIITLTNDGEFFPLDSSVTINYKLRKPDGKFAYNGPITSIIDGRVHITLSEQATACAGVACAELQLSKDSKTISTMSFNVIVEPSVAGNMEIMSEYESDVVNGMINHLKDSDNPHGTTKGQIGLGNVDNKSSAEIRSEITRANVADALGYIPYTPDEIDNKFSALETNIDWKESVPSYKDIASAYPAPVDGWTVNVNDTDYTYRYNGTDWIAISANAIPKATDSVDGLLSKEDHTDFIDSSKKKHTHSNKSVLDGISSDLVTAWNNAVTHVADDTLHVTSAEKTKLANIPTDIVTGVKGNAESAYRTGNVNITKGNIGLGNVDNTSDANKNVASASRMNLPRVTKNVSYQPGANRFVFEEFSSGSDGLPNAQWYHVLTGQGGDANYNTQLAIGMSTTEMYYRNRISGTWGGWCRVPLLVGNVFSNSLVVHGNLVAGNAAYGNKVKMWTDNEGGNIEITSNTGTTTWQADSLGDAFRIYCHNNSTGKNTFPFKLNGDTATIYDLEVSNNARLGNMGVFTNSTSAGIFYIGGINAQSNSYPHLKATQFSNLFQLIPTSAAGASFGHTDAPLSSVVAKNIYNSSGLITSSDRNKKKDFAEITEDFAEQIIDGLIPASFKYIDGDSGRTHYGLVAQDVEKLLEELGIDSKDFAPLIKNYPAKEIENEDGSKELVTDYEAEPEYFLRYEGFTGLILKYIQGLKKENTLLKDKISQFENSLELLNSKLSNI